MWTNVIFRFKKKKFYLDGGEGGDDGWAPEPVRDERKVRQVALDVGLQDDLWSCIAQRGSILIEQVHQLFGDLPVIN